MEKKDATAPDANTNLVQSIIAIDKITIETPAMLNMIKHCNDAKSLQSTNESSGARGTVMGVLKKDLNENILLVT